MNSDENGEELIDWDKRNITRFAQYLYNLAKEKVKQDKDLEDEVLEEVLKKVEEEVKEEVKEKVREKVREKVMLGIKEELPPVTVSDYDPLDEKTMREQALEEVTIGLAKAVEGEVLEEATEPHDQAEIREIIEKEQIPIPSEELETSNKLDDKLVIDEIFETEAPFISENIEEVVEEIVEATIESLEPIIQEHMTSLEPVDLSSPIVMDPIIDEEVLIQPSNIPEDIHKIVFIDEVTSVPITEEESIDMEQVISTKPVGEVIVKDEITSIKSIEEVIDIQEITSFKTTEETFVMEPAVEEAVVMEPAVEEVAVMEPAVEEVAVMEPAVEEVAVMEPAVEEVAVMEPAVEEAVVMEPAVEEVAVTEPVLDAEQTKRREEIIQQMLAETHKREEEEGFAVRELGETEGKAYSAVIVGSESNRNVKKWKKWEKVRIKEEARRAKKLEREQRKKKN